MLRSKSAFNAPTFSHQRKTHETSLSKMENNKCRFGQWQHCPHPDRKKIQKNRGEMEKQNFQPQKQKQTQKTRDEVSQNE